MPIFIVVDWQLLSERAMGPISLLNGLRGESSSIVDSSSRQESLYLRTVNRCLIKFGVKRAKMGSLCSWSGNALLQLKNLWNCCGWKTEVYYLIYQSETPANGDSNGRLGFTQRIFLYLNVIFSSELLITTTREFLDMQKKNVVHPFDQWVDLSPNDPLTLFTL